MIFENELPLNHEPSLDFIAKSWATENVKIALEDKKRGFESYYQPNWDYEYEMSWSAIEDDLSNEGLQWT